MTTRAKRASYRQAVLWIAYNDEPTELDPEFVADLISTMLVADIFGKSRFEVACDITTARRKALEEAYPEGQ